MRHDALGIDERLGTAERNEAHLRRTRACALRFIPGPGGGIEARANGCQRGGGHGSYVRFELPAAADRASDANVSGPPEYNGSHPSRRRSVCMGYIRPE